MIRHISVFTFKDTPDKQQNMETVKAYLEKVPTLYPAIKAQTIGAQAADTPSLPDDAPVMFGDPGGGLRHPGGRQRLSRLRGSHQAGGVLHSHAEKGYGH